MNQRKTPRKNVLVCGLSLNTQTHTAVSRGWCLALPNHCCLVISSKIAIQFIFHMLGVLQIMCPCGYILSMLMSQLCRLDDLTSTQINFIFRMGAILLPSFTRNLIIANIFFQFFNERHRTAVKYLIKYLSPLHPITLTITTKMTVLYHCVI